MTLDISVELSHEGWNRTHALEELQEYVNKMEAAGIDEVIVAYRDLAGLQEAAQLIHS